MKKKILLNMKKVFGERQYRNAPQATQMSLPELLKAHELGGTFGTSWGEPCKMRFEELTGKKWSPEIIKAYGYTTGSENTDDRLRQHRHWTDDKFPPRRTETCPNKDTEGNLPPRQHKHWKDDEDNIPLTNRRPAKDKKEVLREMAQKSLKRIITAMPAIGQLKKRATPVPLLSMSKKKSRRNIFADARLTPTGKIKLQELQEFADPSSSDLYTILSSVAQNKYITSEEIYLDKAGVIEDMWHTALKEGLIISEDLPEDDEFTGGLPGNMPEGIANKIVRHNFAAMPAIETPEERAAVIEQPPIKTINVDPKRPFTPKKRYDKPEQNLSNPPGYSGEDSSGFNRERILLSLNFKKRKN